MNLKNFKVKVKSYLKLVSYSQQQLAEALGFSSYTLSHKLNNTDGAKLSYLDVKQIIKVLVEWEALNKKEEVLELLEIANLTPTSFSQTEWENPPLNRLLTYPTPKPSSGRSPTNMSRTKQHNLPAQLTNFIGRQSHLTALQQLFEQPAIRLVTLVGMGGVGKTRLAIQLASELLPKYLDGVQLIELAPVSEPEALLQTIGQALGLQNQNSAANLVEQLATRRLLLVLDNCEHLIQPVAELAYTLLKGCPNLKILATSREALEIPGEKRWAVPPLNFPASPANFFLEQSYSIETLLGFEAIQLFVERLQAINPLFQFNSQNSGAILQICQKLEGIPLALELTCVWSKTLGLEQIVQHLSNQPDLLNTPHSKYGVDPRHQTLQGLLDWSYNLLSVEQQELWQRLTIFSGSWNLSAAQAICQGETREVKLNSFEVLQLLSQLINKSLVIAEETEAGEFRYRMLEPIRQYAQARLLAKPAGDPELLRQKHAEYYLAVIENSQEGLEDNEYRKATLARLRADHSNLRRALDWFFEARLKHSSQNAIYAEKILLFCQALGQFWLLQSYLTEGRAYLKRAAELLEQPDQSDYIKSLIAKNLYWYGTFLTRQGEHELAVSKIQRSLELYRLANTPTGIVDCLNILGATLLRQLSLEQAKNYHDQALLIAREHDYKMGIALALNGLGNIAIADNKLSEAKAFFEESLSNLQKIKARYGVGVALQNLASIAQKENDYETAWQHYQESLLLWRETEDKWNEITCLVNMGNLCKQLGRYAEAKEFFLSGFVISEQIGEKLYTAIILANLANLAFEQRNWAEAAQYYEQNIPIYQELNDKVRLSRSFRALSNIEWIKGNYAEAEKYIAESLQLVEDTNNKLEIASVLITYSIVLSQHHTNYLQAYQTLQKGLALWQELEDVEGIIKTLACCVILENQIVSYYLQNPDSVSTGKLEFHLKKGAYLTGQVDTLLAQHPNITFLPPVPQDFENAGRSIKKHLDETSFLLAYSAGSKMRQNYSKDRLVNFTFETLDIEIGKLDSMAN